MRKLIGIIAVVGFIVALSSCNSRKDRCPSVGDSSETVQVNIA